MWAVVALRSISSAATLLQAEDFRVEALVFVAVHCESLLQALFCVVRRHDGCDGNEDGDRYDAFDDCGHCGKGGVLIGWRLGQLEECLCIAVSGELPVRARVCEAYCEIEAAVYWSWSWAV